MLYKMTFSEVQMQMRQVGAVCHRTRNAVHGLRFGVQSVSQVTYVTEPSSPKEPSVLRRIFKFKN